MDVTKYLVIIKKEDKTSKIVKFTPDKMTINIKYKDILKLEELGIIKKDTISLPNEFSYTLDDRIVTFKRKR